jgi:hypothetical protein
MSKESEPRCFAFFSNWCTWTAAAVAGLSRLKCAANIRSTESGIPLIKTINCPSVPASCQFI